MKSKYLSQVVKKSWGFLTELVNSLNVLQWYESPSL